MPNTCVSPSDCLTTLLLFRTLLTIKDGLITGHTHLNGTQYLLYNGGSGMILESHWINSVSLQLFHSYYVYSLLVSFFMSMCYKLGIMIFILYREISFIFHSDFIWIDSGILVIKSKLLLSNVRQLKIKSGFYSLSCKGFLSLRCLFIEKDISHDQCMNTPLKIAISY